MFWNKQRPDRPSGRRRRTETQSARMTVELLETRQLMAYSAFGYSLPQLTVSGYTAPAAAPGGILAIDIIVSNRGASSLIEPTNLAPGSLSSADVLSTTVQIFGSATPNGRSGRVLLGSLTTPLIRQNSDFETVVPVVLPSGALVSSLNRFYITLVVNNDRAVLENNYRDNVFRIARPVQVVNNPLPNLQVVGFDIPRPLQPGDVVAPTIRIENLGVGDPFAQGGVTVALVASIDGRFGAGDAVVATFTINSLPGISSVPTQTTIAGAQNLFLTPNQFEITLAPIQLPVTPESYFLGIKIDPAGQLNQTYAPNSNLTAVVPVVNTDQFLTPSTVLVNNTTVPVFPNLPVTFINVSGTGQVPLVTPITLPVTIASATPKSVKAARANRRQ